MIKETLEKLTGKEYKDFAVLNKIYVPDKELISPSIYYNNPSHQSTKYQRVIARRLFGKDKIIEVGSGSGDLSIALAIKFPRKQFIGIEPSASILYAMLKKDMIGSVNSRKEYFSLLKKYIPEEFRRQDEKNHPWFIRKLDNLKFVPEESFSVDSEHTKGDLIFSTFVMNDYYAYLEGKPSLGAFLSSLERLISDEGDIIIIDGDFKGYRSISEKMLKNIAFQRGMNYKTLGDDCFMLDTTKLSKVVKKTKQTVFDLLSPFTA